MKITKNLILYRDFENEQLFYDFTWVMENYQNEYYNKEDVEGLFYECLKKLMELAVSHGFSGNLWHNFLAFLLVNNENAYSRACEIRGEVKGSINEVARHDFAIMKELFDFDLSVLGNYFSVDCMDALLHYEETADAGKLFNKRIRDRIAELCRHLEAAADAEEFKQAVTAFYGEFGVGKLGLHKAFRVRHTDDGAQIIPITNIAHVKLDDLVGYELAKQKLVDNTEAFVSGKEANNCLLYGDAGTGKSTSIKAIANQYYDRGLRLIEIYKHQFCDLNDVIEQIKNRNYKFIIYMDDLSFEEFEIEYKYLKAVIEGGLEKKPDNVLIYATSNRRHLIREKFSDKEEVREDMHTSDTVQEKLSLYARFGVTIYYGAPDKKEFQKIVTTLAEKYGVRLEQEELLLEAKRSGSLPTEDFREERHSSLSIICLENNKEEGGFMAIHTFAAIYIGSYEVSLKIFELSAKKKIRDIDYVRSRIELGADACHSKGSIGYELVEALCDTLREFAQIMKEYRVDAYEAYASAVLRDVDNELFILDQIRLRTGLTVHVLSNSEHRFISYKSVAMREEFEHFIGRSAAVVDVSGSGLQITVFSKGRC